MEIVIKRATPGDLPLVTRLLAEMDGDAPLAPRRAAVIFRQMSGYPFYRCYLAFAGREAVGTFSLIVIPTLVHDGRSEAIVDGVVVAAGRRGRGIGAAMMREAMRLAAAAGCYKLALSSNAKRIGAHRFYAGLGFRRHGVSFSIDCIAAGAAAAPTTRAKPPRSRRRSAPRPQRRSGSATRGSRARRRRAP